MREQTATEPDRFDLWVHGGYAVGSVVVHVSLNAGLWHWVDSKTVLSWPDYVPSQLPI